MDINLDFVPETCAPCPFCGCGAILKSWAMSPWERMHVDREDGKWYSVFCTACGASGPACMTAEDAVHSWNIRL